MFYIQKSLPVYIRLWPKAHRGDCCLADFACMMMIRSTTGIQYMGVIDQGFHDRYWVLREAAWTGSLAFRESRLSGESRGVEPRPPNLSYETLHLMTLMVNHQRVLSS